MFKTLEILCRYTVKIKALYTSNETPKDLKQLQCGNLSNVTKNSILIVNKKWLSYPCSLINISLNNSNHLYGDAHLQADSHIMFLVFVFFNVNEHLIWQSHCPFKQHFLGT